MPFSALNNGLRLSLIHGDFRKEEKLTPTFISAQPLREVVAGYCEHNESPGLKHFLFTQLAPDMPTRWIGFQKNSGRTCSACCLRG